MRFLLIAVAALAAREGPEPTRPDLGWLAGYPGQSSPRLGWLAGYWLSCEDGREVSETWSDPRGDLVLGTSMTSGANGTAWEQMRIAPSTRGMLDSLSFYAQPSGQGAAEFPLVRARGTEAVFENPSHDFPQRIIYRRDGDRLTGRIEGVIGGEARSMEWRYRAAPLNTRCPAA